MIQFIIMNMVFIIIPMIIIMLNMLFTKLIHKNRKKNNPIWMWI